MIQQHWPRLISACVFLVSIWLLAGDAISPPPSWAQYREKGQSIDGYWRGASSDGCYGHEPVIRFTGRDGFTNVDGLRYHSSKDVEVSIQGQHLIVKELTWSADTTKPHLTVETIYADHGDRLVAQSVNYGGEHRDFTKSEGDGPTLVRCGSGGISERLGLLFNEPFREATTVDGIQDH